MKSKLKHKKYLNRFGEDKKEVSAREEQAKLSEGSELISNEAKPHEIIREGEII